MPRTASFSGGAITEGSVDSTIGIYLHARSRRDTRILLLDRRRRLRTRKSRELNRHVLDTPAAEISRLHGQLLAGLGQQERDRFCRSAAGDRRALQTFAADRQHADRRRRRDPRRERFGRDGAGDRPLQLSLDARRRVCRQRARPRRISRDHAAFFDFCAASFIANGYFLQKYNPDGTVASGWHAAWDVHAKTASSCRSRKTKRRSSSGLCGSITTNIATSNSLHRLYRQLVVQVRRFYGRISRRANRAAAAELEPVGRPPRNSHIYLLRRSSPGCGRRQISPSFLPKNDKAAEYETAADEIVAAMREHLYSDELGRFLRSLHFRRRRVT